MKKLKEITLIQWAYVALGALVVNKVLKAKVAVVMKPLPQGSVKNVLEDSSLISSLVTNVVPEVGTDILTPFTDPQIVIAETFQPLVKQADFNNTEDYFK